MTPKEAIMQNLTAERPYTILQQAELVALRPDFTMGDDERIAAARASLAKVLDDFLEAGKIPAECIEVIDGFLFIFNGPQFSQWHRLNWWEQRQQIAAIKDSQFYIDRGQQLLQQSYLASYSGYSDVMVAKSTAQEVKHAWMRKRLVLQECYWNAIDSISHAAYFKKKYDNQFPALCDLLCKVDDRNGREIEIFLGIDNGTGFLYKKKSRDSALFQLLYKILKLFLKSGVFYIGGLELGLLETEARLSCHGSGAVVYQGW